MAAFHSVWRFGPPFGQGQKGGTKSYSIHIDQVPDGVVLAAGMTATVQIDPRPRQAAKRNPGDAPSPKLSV
jgi:hypothetical protein